MLYTTYKKAVLQRLDKLLDTKLKCWESARRGFDCHQTYTEWIVVREINIERCLKVIAADIAIPSAHAVKTTHVYWSHMLKDSKEIVIEIPLVYKQLPKDILTNKTFLTLVTVAKEDVEVLPILADCLEEIGCTDSTLLQLCREKDNIVFTLLGVTS